MGERSNLMIQLVEDLQKLPALGLSSWAAMLAHSWKKIVSNVRKIPRKECHD